MPEKGRAGVPGRQHRHRGRGVDHQRLITLAALIEARARTSLLRRAAEMVRHVAQAESICMLRFTNSAQRYRIEAQAGPTVSIRRFLAGASAEQLLATAARRRSALLVSDFPSRSPNGRGTVRAVSTEGRAMIAVIWSNGRPFGGLLLRASNGARFGRHERAVVDTIAGLMTKRLKRLEAERRSREAMLRDRRLLEASGEVVYEATTLPAFRIRYISPTVETLTGYTPHDLYRDPSPLESLIHPDDLRSSRPDLGHSEDLTTRGRLRFVTKSGRRIWVSIRRTPIVNRTGMVLALQGTMTEVSDQVTESEKLRASVESQMALLEGRRFEVALRLILRHLRYLLSADEVVIASHAGEEKPLKVLSRDGSNGARSGLRQRVERSDPLVRRAIGAKGPVVFQHSVATAIPWTDDQGGLLLVRGLPGDESDLHRAADTAELFAELIAAAGHAMRAFTGQLRKAVEEDRSRIARELHDGIVQSLFAVVMQLQLDTGSLAEPVRSRLLQVTGGIRETIQDIQQYVFDLEPSLLIVRGLEGSLQQLVADFQAGSGIEVRLRADADAVTTLQGYAPHVLQIVREALSNVRRHSEAQHAEVMLDQKGGSALLEIRDDGRGFDAESALGMGLRNLRNRVRQLRGKLELHSEPGGGSLVRVTVPGSVAVPLKTPASG